MKKHTPATSPRESKTNRTRADRETHRCTLPSRKPAPAVLRQLAVVKTATAPTGRIPTTSFLTATTLVYAAGAGITAAAGTRLALQ